MPIVDVAAADTFIDESRPDCYYSSVRKDYSVYIMRG